MRDLPSYVIGLISGVIVTIIIVWMLVRTRSFMFSIMPTRNRKMICTRRDYYNDPGDAIADGHDQGSILFLNSDNKLIYKRVPRYGTCVPMSSNQTVKMKHPQYCLFRGIDGNDYEAKNQELDSPLYVLTSSDGTQYSILSSGECGVLSSDSNFVVGGTPILKWDSNQ